MTETPQPPETPPATPPQGPAGQPQSNGLAIAGMVLGIVGLVGICIWWLGLPCAIVGLILSMKGKKKAQVTGTGAGLATAGIVCSLIALGLAALGIIFAIIGFAIIAPKAMEMQQGTQGAVQVLRSLYA